MLLLIVSTLLKIVFCLVVLLTCAPVLVWAERRQSAMIQDRVGPHRGGFPMPKLLLDNLTALKLGAIGFGALNLLLAAGCFLLIWNGYGALNLQSETFAADLDTLGTTVRTGAWGYQILGTGWNWAMFGIQWLLGLVGLTLELPFATPSGMFLLGAVVGLAHIAIGQILPSFFFDGKLTLYGLLHPLADAVKMFWKEDFVPPNADKFLFALAPIIALVPAIATFAAIPFGPTLFLDHWADVLPESPSGSSVPLQAVSLNVGILYIFAIAGTGIVGAAIAGYSSDNKYALLGGLRAAGQMVSYEVTLGLSLVGCFMIYGSLRLEQMVAWQESHVWGILVQPMAFILFLVASIAETKRVPFDVAEGESEIVAGYFLEYSGFKFGMFFMGEFLEVVTSAGLIATLFFGGFDVPFILDQHGFHWGDTRMLDAAQGTWFSGIATVLNSHVFVVLFHVGAFLLKMLLLMWLSLMIRWTMPRFRYDQIMQLCWKKLLPLSLLNVLATGILVLAFPNWFN